MNSNTTEVFWQHYYSLPADVRQTARQAYALWQTNPLHPGLHFKQIGNSNIYAVRVGLHYRALGLRNDPNTITWFWIGTNHEYDYLIKNL